MKYSIETLNYALRTLLKRKFWGWRIASDTTMLVGGISLFFGLSADNAVSLRYLAVVFFLPFFCLSVIASVRASRIAMFSEDLSLPGCLVHGDVRPLGKGRIWYKAVLYASRGHILTIILPKTIQSGSFSLDVRHAFRPLFRDCPTLSGQTGTMASLVELAEIALSEVRSQRKQVRWRVGALTMVALFLFLAFPCPLSFLVFEFFLCLLVYLAASAVLTLQHLKNIKDEPTDVLTVYSEREPSCVFGQPCSVVHWITKKGKDIVVRNHGCCRIASSRLSLHLPRKRPLRHDRGTSNEER